jgi:pimeloyl-ACP methyl ester carboxylesterase
MAITVQEIEANGYRFSCRESGTRGEPVLLLHGFPETSRMWDPLMERLTSEGYRCLAPDQRGYSPGARPADVDAYRYECLVDDVCALAAAADMRRFHLVAHDWGAGVGWALLSIEPSTVATFSTLSVPHYRAFVEAVWADPEQALYRNIMDLFLSRPFV